MLRIMLDLNYKIGADPEKKEPGWNNPTGFIFQMEWRIRINVSRTGTVCGLPAGLIFCVPSCADRA